jgi:hypothetical protein
LSVARHVVYFLALHACGGDSTSPVPTGPVDPAPRPGDRILLDTRTTLQQADSLAEALALFPDRTSGIALSMNVDGRGTKAFRIDWPGSSGQCVDEGRWLIHYLPTPYPKRLYVQWKMRMGRTASGGGIGPVSQFQLTNPACGNAGRKILLALRDVSDRGLAGRIDYVWPGPSPVRPRFEGSGTGDVALGPNQGVAFDPQSLVGDVITQTVYLQAASSGGAADGVLKLWVNKSLVLEEQSVRMGASAFHRFQFPTIFRAPVHDQTEYFWDIIAWEPKS